jgi:hypothetical protein
MTALNDSIRIKPLAEWHGPTSVDGIVKMLSFTPALGRTDGERVQTWLGDPGAKYLPMHLRRDLERRYRGR